VFSKAIVRPPSANFADGLTSVELGEPIFALALQQHDAYCTALEHCGLTLTPLVPDDRYPDATFVEDTALLTPRGAVITRPGASSRMGETEEIERLLRREFPELKTIQSPGTVDAGDVCETKNHFFIGVSQRTNEHGARQLAAFLEDFGYTATLIDIRSLSKILHLKSGLAYLHPNRLVAIDELKEQKEFSGYELIHVSAAEAYAANCLPVNGRVLIASGFPRFQRQLERLGYETIVLEMSEFQKMDGGLSCLSVRW
jgi:dimethylargininase